MVSLAIFLSCVAKREVLDLCFGEISTSMLDDYLTLLFDILEVEESQAQVTVHIETLAGPCLFPGAVSEVDLLEKVAQVHVVLHLNGSVEPIVFGLFLSCDYLLLNLGLVAQQNQGVQIL